MTNAHNTAKWWVFSGALVILVLGSLFHFTFHWSGESGMIGLFVPVNESVWEHLKMGYWALAVYSVFEYAYIRNTVNNYLLAKCTGILALELTILLIFYSQVAITQTHLFWVDIASYVLGTMICQFLTYRLFLLNPALQSLRVLFLVVFIGLGIVFGVFTYYPPHYRLFIDQRDQTYGIQRER